MNSATNEIESLRNEVKRLKEEVADLRDFVKSLYFMISEDGEYEDEEYAGGAEVGRFNT